jgi:ribonuclease P protein component
MDRLRQRADFLAVANGTRANSAAFVVQGRLRDDDGPIRIGFTVTKKNGTATERNRIRRRLRELVKRLDVISVRPHHDYVVVGRRAALTRDFATMLDDLRSALHRLDRQPANHGGSKAFSSEVGTGSRSNQVDADCVDLSAIKRVQTKSEALGSDASRNRKDPQSELNGETPER